MTARSTIAGGQATALDPETAPPAPAEARLQAVARILAAGALRAARATRTAQRPPIQEGALCDKRAAGAADEPM